MTNINRYYIRMLAFLTLITVIVWVLHQPLIAAFRNNIPLNTAILVTLTFGISLIFYRLYSLKQEQKWFETFEKGEERFPGTPLPKILLPLSIMFKSDPNGQPTLSTLAMRSVLTSIDARLDESRDVTRYLIGVLIFLGLLGTFWGLSLTIGAIAHVITGLDVGAANVKDSFQNLKDGLQSPLTGMGTAFSTSMFGLAGSLVLGFLDLQVGKAAGSFYHDLENHLTGMTKDTGEMISLSPAHSGPAYLQSLLEQTAESMSHLQTMMRRHEENRSNVVQSLQLVGEKISTLTEHMVSQQVLLKKMAQGHVDLQKQLEQFAAIMITPTAHGADEGIKQYLRNLDATTLRLLDELIEGRNKGFHDIKGEIRLVAKTISALANQEVA